MRLTLSFLFVVVALGFFLSASRAQDGGESQIQGICYGTAGKDGRVPEIRCPDGHFHAADGYIQPDTCDNNYLGSDGQPQPESHKCQCVVATTDFDHCPMEGLVKNYSTMGPKCSTSCREDACKCVNRCDFQKPDAGAVKPKAAPKKKGK